MLSKKVCKSCINRYDKYGWQKNDDKQWTKGFIVCPEKIDVTIFSVNYTNSRNRPPKGKCPYYLEHLLKNKDGLV